MQTSPMAKPGLMLGWWILSAGLCCAGLARATPMDAPAARWGAVLVYDAAREQVVLFGGSPSRQAYFGDTWTWDRAGWRRHPVAGPPARAFAAASFDSSRGQVVLHGGRGQDNRTLGDTWIWDGAGWLKLGDSAFQADHHALFYDTQAQQTLAFGGWSGTDVLGDTWRLVDTQWQPVIGDGPHKRSAFGLSWDPSAQRAMVYGGLWINGQYADLWAWQAGKWRVLTGPYDNSSLDHHSMIWDHQRQQLLGFGGKNYRYRTQGVTFVLEGQTITPLEVAGPSPRHSFGLTYDLANRQAVLFGGKQTEGETFTALGDLWLWDGRQWRQWLATKD